MDGLLGNPALALPRLSKPFEGMREMGLRKLTATALGYGTLVAVLFACASTALAAGDRYANFSKCPTGAPEMNDPSSKGAICVSGLVRKGSIKVGNFQANLTSPMHLQFGAVVNESEEMLVVPGSTSLEVESFILPNPFAGPPVGGSPPVIGSPPVTGSPPVGSPAPGQAKKPKKKHRCVKHRKGKHEKRKRCGKRRAAKKHHKKMQVPQQPPPAAANPSPSPVDANPSPPAGPNLIKATLEPAGDVPALNPAALFGGTEPLFELPVKVHLEGAELGPACFIGTDAEPIVLAPLQVSPPTEFGAGQDPNGFKVETLSLGGIGMEDATFAVGAASGCGPQGSLDGPINALLGLPASAGASKAIMGDMLVELAGAENDHTSPESGEELQAAFEAAQ
jgi:hypothetical protein